MKNKEDFSNLILSNIAELYNKFIETKIKIQFIRSGIEIERNQDLYEEQREKFYENHIKLSSLILFESDYQKKENDLLNFCVSINLEDQLWEAPSPNPFT